MIAWPDKKNRRRGALIDLEIAGTISQDERKELAQLKKEMLAYRRRVAPLPLDGLRELHEKMRRTVADCEV